MASCRVGPGFLLPEVPNILFMAERRGGGKEGEGGQDYDAAT